jgi:hypothetical protein
MISRDTDESETTPRKDELGTPANHIEGFCARRSGCPDRKFEKLNPHTALTNGVTKRPPREDGTRHRSPGARHERWSLVPAGGEHRRRR